MKSNQELTINLQIRELYHNVTGLGLTLKYFPALVKNCKKIKKPIFFYFKTFYDTKKPGKLLI